MTGAAGAGTGGAPARFVGIDPARAAALAGELERLGDDLGHRSVRIQRLLDQARSVGAAAPTASPALLAAGRWADTTAGDLRWRIQAVGADPAAWSSGTVMSAVLDFADRRAMVAAATAHAARLASLVAIADKGALEVGAKRLQAGYPQLVEELRAAAVRAGDDPMYAAALVEALGVLGTGRLLDVAIAAVRDQGERGRANDDGRVRGQDVLADVIEPFARIFATSTRAGSAGMAEVDAEMLRPRTPTHFRHLSLLLTSGVASVPFTVDAAAVLLRDRKGLGRLGVHVLPMFSPWPDLEVAAFSATRALERNPEAAFRFVTAADNAELILRLERHPAIGDGPGLHHSAGRVLELALFDWPAANPAAVAASEVAFTRIVTSVADRGVPSPVKRSLAAVTAFHLDGLVDRVDRRSLSRFFGDLARDDGALSVLGLGLGLYARDQLSSGLREAVSSDLSVLPPMGEMGEELARISALYGAAGSGIVRVVEDDEAAVKRLVAGLRFASDAAAGIGLAASGVSGPVGAVAGIGAKFLVGQGAEAVGRLAAAGGPVVESYLDEAVAPSLRRLVALELYANEATRRDTGAVPPPPDRLSGDHIAVPPPGAFDGDRRAFWAWFDQWYALPGNRSLRDQSENLATAIEARVIDHILLTRHRKG